MEHPKTLKTRRVQAQIRRDRNGDGDDDAVGVEPYAHESHLVPASTGSAPGRWLPATNGSQSAIEPSQLDFLTAALRGRRVSLHWSRTGERVGFSLLNGRYPKTQSANDRFGVSKPNARLRSGHDDQCEDGPSCKRSPVPPNGGPADVRYLALISMVAMTAMGTILPFRQSWREPAFNLNRSGSPGNRAVPPGGMQSNASRLNLITFAGNEYPVESGLSTAARSAPLTQDARGGG